MYAIRSYYGRYIASDIHKKYSVIGGVDREGRVMLHAVRVEHADLEGWLQKNLLPTDHVVIESTRITSYNVCYTKLLREWQRFVNWKFNRAFCAFICG